MRLCLDVKRRAESVELSRETARLGYQTSECQTLWASVEGRGKEKCSFVCQRQLSNTGVEGPGSLNAITHDASSGGEKEKGVIEA